MQPSRTPGQRAGLTREAVLAATSEVLSEVGLDALSMRAIARRLDVAPNALYSHVAGKQDLLDQLLDDALADVKPGRLPREPIAGLRALMTATYDTLLLHGELVPIYLTRQGARGPNAQRLGELARTQLLAAGVHGTRVDHALHVLIIHTIAFAAFASHPNIDSHGRPGRSATAIRRDFTTSLTWLLNGIQTSD